MEIQRERNAQNDISDEESTNKRSRSLACRPSAPDLDAESLSNVVEDDWQWQERAQPTSLWTKIRTSFSKYRQMQESTNEVSPELNPQSTNPQSTDPLNKDIFNNFKNRNQLLRKIYALFFAQFSFLTTLSAIFYYSPHIRQIFRKTFADRIFLKSLFGAPLGVLAILLLVFQSLRRKYALICFLLLSTILSSILCYLMAFQKDNLVLLMEMGMMDGCFLLAGVTNTIMPMFNMKRRYEVIFFPMTMGLLQTMQPFLISQKFSSTWIKNLLFVSGVGYLGFNLNSIMNDTNLSLKKDETVFALTQSYINLNPAKSFKNLFTTRPPAAFQRI